MTKLMMFAGAAALAFAAQAVAKPGHGHGWGNSDRDSVGYGMGGCPPGLAKKNNGCMPPGQARKLHRGQRFQQSYGSRYGFGQIPYNIRQQYNLDPRDRYYYGNGNLYQVDPRTMLVEQVIGALLRR